MFPDDPTMELNDETLLTEMHDANMWVIFNRPSKANAMTVSMMERATAAIVQAGRDPEIKAIVLTGAGERVFTAGVDIREKPEDGNQAGQRERRSHALAALQDAVLDTPKPIVAALNGSAVGGGAMLALLADACVAVESAAISLPEIDIGIASFSGSNILAVAGGRALALDLIQSGRPLDVADARARGLVRAVVARSELPSAADALARSLSAKDAHAFADNKRWINRAMQAAIAEARAEHARHRAKTSP